MTYQIRQEQKMVTFKTLEQVENKGLTTSQVLALNASNNLSNSTYNKYNNLYNSVTYAYAKALDRATKDTDKLLTSIPVDSGYMFFYKLLVDKGNTTKLDNYKEARNEYDNFNNTVTNNYRAINKKYYRSTKALTLQVSNTSTEHAFRNKFNSILLHNHALLLTNSKLPTKELEQVIASKLPNSYKVKVKEFTKYKSDEQLILNNSNRHDTQVITSLTNWLTYMYKTVAQKPFKNYLELNNFEKLPLEKRYNLIRVQQLITNGIRKHKSLTIHFPSTELHKLRIKYLQYLPIIKYTKENTYNLIININNIHLTCSNTYSKAHIGLFNCTYIITNNLTLTSYNKPIIDTGWGYINPFKASWLGSP